MVGNPPERVETISRYELSLIDVFKFINLNNAEAIFQRLRKDLKVSEISRNSEYFIPEWNIALGQLITIIQRLGLKRQPTMDETETIVIQELVTYGGFEIFMGWFINFFSSQDTFFVDGSDIVQANRLLRRYREINSILTREVDVLPAIKERDYFEVGSVYQATVGNQHFGFWTSEELALQHILDRVPTKQPGDYSIKKVAVFSHNPDSVVFYTPQSHLGLAIPNAIGEIYEVFVGNQNCGCWKTREEALLHMRDVSPIARPGSDLPSEYSLLGENEYYIQPRMVYCRTSPVPSK